MIQLIPEYFFLPYQRRLLTQIYVAIEKKRLGMHDIYRTDKLSTDMGENYVIFIAPINKWNAISRAGKVRLLVNQSISLIYLRFICFPSASDWRFKLQRLSVCVALITSSFVNMSSPVWKFFSVAEEDNAIAMCNACSARIQKRGKKASSFNNKSYISLKRSSLRQNCIKDFKQPPFLHSRLQLLLRGVL